MVFAISISYSNCQRSWRRESRSYVDRAMLCTGPIRYTGPSMFCYPSLDVPNNFDIPWQKAFITEGPSDALILQLMHRVLDEKVTHAIYPGSSAANVGTLIALNMGWNVDFKVLLDSDSEAHSLRAAVSLSARPQASLVLLSSYSSPLRVLLRKELNVSRIYWDFTKRVSYLRVTDPFSYANRCPIVSFNVAAFRTHDLHIQPCKARFTASSSFSITRNRV